MNPSDILIVQTSTGGVSLCVSTLRRQNIIRNEDYLASSNTGILDENIVTSKPQLLIINSFRGDLPIVKELVDKKREVNPQLITLLVDCNIKLLQLDKTFDGHIDMFDKKWFEELAGKINAFKAGALRRAVEPASLSQDEKDFLAIPGCHV